MPKMTKRAQAIAKKVQPKIYPILQAFEVLQSLPAVKFVQTVEVAINLGINPLKSDQVVRGAVVLPNGTGKSVRVAVFAQGPQAEAAKKAGAEIVGMDDLAADIKKGEINFDVLIASPDAMRLVGQLGQILGPKGLMPNPKVGTVTADVALAVRNAKAGQVQYRNDKAGIIHCSIGKLNFEPQALLENLEALVADLRRAKPVSAKGVYFKKLHVSSTMGPGLVIDLSSVKI